VADEHDAAPSAALEVAPEAPPPDNLPSLTLEEIAGAEAVAGIAFTDDEPG